MSGGVDSAVAAARAVEAGHEVVGVARNTDALPGHRGLTAEAGSVHDLYFVQRVATGADAVVIAIQSRATETSPAVSEAIVGIAQTVAKTGARLGVVGGAGNLFVAEGGPRLLAELLAELFDHPLLAPELSSARTLRLDVLRPGRLTDQFHVDGHVPLELDSHEGQRLMLANAAAMNYGFPPARPFTPTRWLEDGDTVTLGSHTLHVRHCPGHTPGHVVFHSPEIQRAFVGDVLFAGSIGRTDFPQGNHEDLIRSIRERLWPMGNETVFIPGHGPESTFGRERQSNPYVHDL